MTELPRVGPSNAYNVVNVWENHKLGYALFSYFNFLAVLATNDNFMFLNLEKEIWLRQKKKNINSVQIHLQILIYLERIKEFSKKFENNQSLIG